MELTRHIFGDFTLPPKRCLGVFGPKRITGTGLTDYDIRVAVENPVGTPALSELAKGRKKVLIITDDNTRATPCHRILPVVLDILRSRGIAKKNITILIGLGTHRGMTEDEIRKKFGETIAHDYRVVNHDWDNPEALVSLGQCDLGFEVVINRLVNEADLTISVGSIVPHATVGFSGGGKTIMPGICGEKTIEETHWKALDYSMAEILGQQDNPVRVAINAVCRKANLDFIINTVLFDEDKIYSITAGDLVIAHESGVEKSKEVYGVVVPGKADIVIAEAFPTDIDLRQAIKAICSADIVTRDGGVMILPADCPEGVAPQFPAFEHYGFKDPDKLFSDVESGRLDQKLMVYTLVAIGRIISKRVKAILVSSHIGRKQAEHMGFLWSDSMEKALENAYTIMGYDARTMMLLQAGELLPIINPEPDKTCMEQLWRK